MGHHLFALGALGLLASLAVAMVVGVWFRGQSRPDPWAKPSTNGPRPMQAPPAPTRGSPGVDPGPPGDFENPNPRKIPDGEPLNPPRRR